MLAGVQALINFKNKNSKLMKSLFERFYKDNMINGSIYFDNIYITRHVNVKFLHDKVFYHDKYYCVVLDGVILNSGELIRKYNKDSFFECVVVMYEKNGIEFFMEFNGDYWGILFDKKRDIQIIFNNRVGTRNIFYSINEDFIVVGSDINYVTSYLRGSGASYTFDAKIASIMLDNFYMPHNFTLFCEIKRLLNGYYIYIENRNVDLRKYYNYFCKNKLDLPEENVIYKLDNLFRCAVKNAFQKDIDYGYKHIACLSAGLDSKIVTWVAHELGFGKNIVNITYSQPDFWDETVPKEMTADMAHKYIYFSLSNGLHSMEINENTALNGGCYFYLGTSSPKSIFSQINMESFGMVHTGIFSDILSGRFNGKDGNNRKAAALIFLFKGLAKTILQNYYNMEEYSLYETGFSSENTQMIGIHSKSEIYSPFFDNDLLEFLSKIPDNMRSGLYLYKKWLLNKYPKVCGYVYDKIDSPLTENFQHSMPPPYKKYAYTLKSGAMNPLDYWYETSPFFKNEYIEYFHKNIDNISFAPDLQHKATEMFHRKSVNYKALILTILASAGIYKS